jgi:hypothetical protein
VDGQLFAGAGAKIFGPAPAPGLQNHIKFYKKNINHTKNLKISLKIKILVILLKKTF